MKRLPDSFLGGPERDDTRLDFSIIYFVPPLRRVPLNLKCIFVIAPPSVGQFSQPGQVLFWAITRGPKGRVRPPLPRPLPILCRCSYQALTIPSGPPPPPPSPPPRPPPPCPPPYQSETAYLRASALHLYRPTRGICASRADYRPVFADSHKRLKSSGRQSYAAVKEPEPLASPPDCRRPNDQPAT